MPAAVYVDLKNLYISPGRLKKSQAEDDRQSKEGLSVFQRVCRRLHIKVIKAYSAQAKGRVERNHGVYQDRFVKELKLNSIKTIKEANQFLLEKYIDKINGKFAKEPANQEDSHRLAQAYGDLKEVFCWEYTRQVQNDWTVRMQGQYYQILKEQAIEIKAKQKITVKVYLDGTTGLWFKGQRLSFQETSKAQTPVKTEPKRRPNSMEQAAIARKNKAKTPWSQYNPGWLKQCNSSPWTILTGHVDKTVDEIWTAS